MQGKGWILTAVVTVVSFALPCRAGAPTREYQVKAAFIFNFTQFVEWPDNAFSSSDAPFVVAVMRRDPFDGSLEEAMDGKSVGRHPIVIKHFDNPEDIGACQLLFVPSERDDALSSIFGKVGKNPVLTVGETDSFMASGGHFRFYIDGNRIRFEIDPDTVEGVGLKVSAKLLKLARIYKK
jgi:hypothetical protein